ncbi:MAG TPA: glycosyltransferase family 4 protein [Steroidobacteraceae bacterium]
MVNSTLHIGGAEQVAACLSMNISPERFETSACYLKEPGIVAEQILRGGVDLVPVPGLVPGRRDYFTSLKLRKLILERDIDVIHTHDIHGLIDGSICRSMLPRLRHVHTFHFGNYPHRRFRYKLIERALWRIPDALIAVGHAQAASISAAYGIPAERLRVIWNGVEDPAFDAAGAISVDAPPDTPVIASISTLIPQKGLSHLLDAAALLRDWGERFVLLIAGDGGLKQPLHEQAQALKLGEHVRFLGWVPQASRRVLPKCDIFVQSSLWEAMSIVVLEAMAAGKPMVVTSVGENPHVVVNGETGLLVPPADPAALATALRSLLKDSLMRARLGAAARARYQDEFTVRHMLSAHEDLYRELAGAKDRHAPPVTVP